MDKYIIVIDQGTTSTRVILFDSRSNIIGIEQKELKFICKDDAILQDANVIYNDAVELMVTLLRKVNVNYADILGVGITNQRETTVLWDKDSLEPVDYAIVWQSTHTNYICQEMVEKGYGDNINEKTGLLINPYFSASKIAHILRTNSYAKELMDKKRLHFGTIDSWLVAKLTNGIHVTDYTNASRTMLFNINTLDYDQEILNWLEIDRDILPKVIGSNDYVGTIKDKRIQEFGNFKICALIGDQQSSLFGHTCFDEGSFKITYGTGSFMLLNTEEKLIKSKNGLLTTIAFSVDGRVNYALEGSVFVAGSAFQFIRDNLDLIKDYNDEVFNTANNGVYFVPALTGLGAPYWKTDAKGAIFGLTRGTRKEDIVRATLEGVAFLNYDVFKAMKDDSGIDIREISVDGGASRNANLMQFESDIMNVNIKTISTSEATALGAYYLVGLRTGLFKDFSDVKRFHKYIKVYNPNINRPLFEKRYQKWKKALAATLSFTS